MAMGRSERPKGLGDGCILACCKKKRIGLDEYRLLLRTLNRMFEVLMLL